MQNRNFHSGGFHPFGLVGVNKGPYKDLQVGVLDARRIPAMGFDVRGLAPNHWRNVAYGNFGVVVCARSACEVRVLLDDKLILETTLYPANMQHMAGSISADALAAMAESLQPHMITADKTGKPFVFAKHDPSLNPDDIVREQIQPGIFSAAPTIEMIDNGAAPRNDAPFTLDPSMIPFLPQVQKRSPDEMPAPNDPAYAAMQSALAARQNGAPDSAEAAPESTEAATALDAPSVAQEEPAESESVGVINHHQRRTAVAPSHGLLSIGVRMIQLQSEHEGPLPPDTFAYTVFQLNPPDLYMKARVKLTSRIIIPSVAELHRMMVAEGFGSEAGAPPQDFCGCGRIGDHKH